MSNKAYSLNEMDPNTFEHMANALAIKVLGSGLTTFGPGADGGRDGWFQGEAEYPSTVDKWSGEWYIQSKYHRPHLSTDHNKWLINQVKGEIKEFTSPSGPRRWPDNWIIVTNIDYSVVPKTGAFDTIKSLIKKANPALAERFSIWGGEKVKALLAAHSDVAQHYGSFITPGNVLAALHDELADSKASIKDILRYLIVSQFTDQQFTKLEQAGSSADNRPGIQKLFRDIPFASSESRGEQMAAKTLAKALAQNHSFDGSVDLQTWHQWQRSPRRARVWFVKGGPGQGKSTITQYLSQIQRAALILGDSNTRIAAKLRPAVNEIRDIANRDGLWPKLPRVPVIFELKEYAKWIARQGDGSIAILAYLSERIEETGAQKALAGTLKRAFSTSRWLFVFDGMDEVPGDVKDRVAKEINYFVDDLLIDCSSDAQIVCTSRPQGYSGQFDSLDAADIRLTNLSPAQALECAKPILEIDRPPREGARLCSILSEALSSQAIREIMTTPLQAHIMAVVVRDGGRPPERKWELFSNFYKVINKREADKSADKKLSALLRGHGKLIKALHNRLGFELHARAEASAGAQASLERDKLLDIIEETVKEFQTDNAEETIKTLREATTDRLVLVNTPENSESVRFDIRPLQEFFAAEYIYESASYHTLSDRVRTISADSHWREVLHFLLSALIENERRGELAQVIQVLAEVDDPVIEEFRPLSRRLALGAQAVTRLLQEGVLEEDQRIRQNFKACLLPIFATTDIWTGLLSVDREHSRNWTLDVIKEVIADQVEPENIGAAAAACCLVDSNARQASDLRHALLTSTMAYRACVLSILALEPQSAHRRKSLTPWGMNIVLSTLLDAKWVELGQSGTQNAFRLLEEAAGREALKSLGVSDGATEIVAAMLKGYGFNEPDHGIVREQKYGIVSVSLHPPIDVLDAINWSDEVYEELIGLGGFVRLGAAVAKAASMQDGGSTWFIENHQADLEHVDLLPLRMRAYLDPELKEKTAEIGSDRLTSLRVVRENHKGQLESFGLVHGSSEKEMWPEFAREHPDMALHLMSMSGSRFGQRNAEEILKAEGAAEVLLGLLKGDRRRALSTSAVWGRFIGYLPDYEPQLRKIFVNAAAGGTVVYPRYEEDVAPIPLCLPQEATLLPYAVMPIVQAATDRRSERSHIYRDQRSRSNQIKRARAQARNVCSQTDDLAEIANDNARDSIVRASAYVLLALTGEDRANIPIADVKALVSMYCDETRPWFLAALGLALNDAIEADREDVKAELSRVLQGSRADYESRVKMDPLIERWREITRTPVLKSSREIWK